MARLTLNAVNAALAAAWAKEVLVQGNGYLYRKAPQHSQGGDNLPDDYEV